ncbi:UNKNOWN [Stylonychia lemnae]|uniref:Uncharacterized protein n=1 Tax=Stylonychia lemnae TaxID=5949 RepID=A0A078AVH1_STYLE|nr:UNKNOWN [Stylonychia lemnae]|eukprot:CDW86056.1 UNKNOWN [Stylonychia lemnae]
MIFSAFDSHEQYGYFFFLTKSKNELEILILYNGGREQNSILLQEWYSDDIYDVAFSYDGKNIIFGGDVLSGIQIFNRLHWYDFSYIIDIDRSGRLALLGLVSDHYL